MLSSAASQKLERYANFALVRCGCSALSKVSPDAVEPVNLWSFVTSSYKDAAVGSSGEAEQGAAYGAGNISVLTNVTLWEEALASLQADRQNHMSASSRFSESFLIAMALSVLMLTHEAAVEDESVSFVKTKDCLDEKLIHLLACHEKLLLIIGQHGYAESTGMTMAFAVVLNALADLWLQLYAVGEVRRLDTSQDCATRATQVDRVMYLALSQLHRCGTKYPLPKLFTVRLLAQQLKSILSNSNSGDVSVAHTRRRLRLVPKLSLIYRQSAVKERGGEAVLRRAIIHLLSPYINNRASRYYVYFRSEVDDVIMKKMGCTDTAVRSSAITYACFTGVDPTLIENCFATECCAREALSLLIQAWSASVEVVYEAFCADPSWASFATEQKRRAFAREAKEREAVLKRASKEQDKLIQKQLYEKALAEVSKNTSNEARDPDETGSQVSNMSRAETDLRSEMSEASYTSLTSFLSVVDSEAAASSVRLQHESSDGNSNLPLILLELCSFALHHFVRMLKGSHANKAGNHLVVSCWEGLEGMFRVVSAAVTAQGVSGTTFFSLADDVQFNLGLGYQCFGIIFAKIVLPVLLHEGEAPSVPKTNSALTEIEAKHVAQTLFVFEKIAPQVVNQNLASVLNVCCESAGSSKLDPRLTPFVRDCVLRLARTNDLTLLINVFNSAGGVHKHTTTVSEEDADEEGKDAALEDGSSCHSMYLSLQSATALLKSDVFRTAFSGAVRSSINSESLFDAVVVNLCNRLAELEAVNSPQAVAALFSAQIPVACGLIELVAQGLSPTSLTSLSLFEKLMEADTALVVFAVGTLVPLLINDFTSGPEEASARTVWCAAVDGGVSRKTLRALFLAVAETLVFIRDGMFACLQDLGVDRLDQFVMLINETVWRIGVDDETCVEGEDEEENVAFISYGSELTADDSLKCVSASTRSIFTGLSYSSIFAKLAAQRLRLIASVSALLDLEKRTVRCQGRLADFVIEQLEQQKQPQEVQIPLLTVEWDYLIRVHEWGERKISLSSISGHPLAAAPAAYLLAQLAPPERLELSEWKALLTLVRRGGVLFHWEMYLRLLCEQLGRSSSERNEIDTREWCAGLISVVELVDVAARVVLSTHPPSPETIRYLLEIINRNEGGDSPKQICDSTPAKLLLSLYRTALQKRFNKSDKDSSAALRFINCVYTCVFESDSDSKQSPCTLFFALTLILREVPHLLPRGVLEAMDADAEDATGAVGEAQAALQACGRLLRRTGSTLLKALESAETMMECADGCESLGLLLSQHLPPYFDSGDISSRAASLVSKYASSIEAFFTRPDRQFGEIWGLALLLQLIVVLPESESKTNLIDRLTKQLQSECTRLNGKGASLGSIRPEFAMLFALPHALLLRSGSSNLNALATAALSLVLAIIRLVAKKNIEAAAEVLIRLKSVPHLQFSRFKPAIELIFTEFGSVLVNSRSSSPHLLLVLRTILTTMRLPRESLLGDSSLVGAFVSFCSVVSSALTRLLRAEAAAVRGGTLKGIAVAEALAEYPGVVRALLQTWGFIAANSPSSLSHFTGILPLVWTEIFQLVLGCLELYGAARAARLSGLSLELERILPALLTHFSTTMFRTLRALESDLAVVQTSLTAKPDTTPAAMAACAIVSSVFGSLRRGLDTSLFALYSNELDFFARDLIEYMLRGRLCTGKQGLLFEVKVERLSSSTKRNRENSPCAETEDVQTNVAEEEKIENEDARDSAQPEAELNLIEIKASEMESQDQPEPQSKNTDRLKEVVESKENKRRVEVKHRKLPLSAQFKKQLSNNNFADVCFASLQLAESQSLLKNEIMRIKADEGRTIFMPDAEK